MVPEQGLKKALWRKAYLGRKKKKKKEDNEQQITSNSPTAVFLHLTMVHIMK